MNYLKKMGFLLLLTISVSVSAQQTVFKPERPEAGKTLSFTYRSADTNLADEKEIVCRAQTFVNLKEKMVDVPLVRDGDLFRGSFIPADSTELVCLIFSVGDNLDDDSSGYYTLFYEKGLPLANSYLAEALLFTGMGRAAGIKLNPAKGVKSFEKAFERKPSLKDEYGTAYLTTLYGLDKAKAKPLIYGMIKDFKRKKEQEETDLILVMKLYNILNNKVAEDSLKSVAIAQYPRGISALRAARMKVYDSKDPDIVAQKIAGLIEHFGLDTNKTADAAGLSNLYYVLVDMYVNAKNQEKMDFYAAKVRTKSSLSALLNSRAWRWTEKKENLDFSAVVSKKSLDLLIAAKNDEVPSSYASKEKYLADLDRSYAMNADTYALILHYKGKDKEAVVYQEMAQPFADAEGNDRYVMYLDLSGDREKAFKEADRLLRLGKGTNEMKNRFQVLYEAKKPETTFDIYMAGVEKEAVVNRRAEWMKKMIHVPAPAFKLQNLKGEMVSLVELKGKVVVLDYWATWCGPCVASFPGMQKAVTKYATDPNVVFLFVNTWQREGNREKLVSDFIAEKKYSFNVLYDTKNKQDPNEFNVISAYRVRGIPTKFVIGPDGYIKFKTSGFSGSADGMVRELDDMISLAKTKK
jgi:thiol-disulfide isomerase/thioredoxin